MSLPHIYIAIVIVSFLTSLVAFRLRYPFHLKLFSVFLGITVLTEIIANFGLGLLHLDSNFPVYAVFMLVEYIMIAWYYKRILSSQTAKIIVAIFMILFPFFWITTVILLGLNAWNSYVIMCGDLFTICISARFLFQLFTAEKLVNFKTCAEFWIAAGITFYYCCELPITGMLNYLRKISQPMTNQLYTILQILNIIMYAIFMYAYLCRVKSSHMKTLIASTKF